MRQDLRAVYPEPRMRNDIVKFLWNWIIDRGEKLESGVYIEVPVEKVPKATKKRKAAEPAGEDDDDGEEEPPKTKRKATAKGSAK